MVITIQDTSQKQGKPKKPDLKAQVAKEWADLLKDPGIQKKIGKQEEANNKNRRTKNRF